MIVIMFQVHSLLLSGFVVPPESCNSIHIFEVPTLPPLLRHQVCNDHLLHVVNHGVHLDI